MIEIIISLAAGVLTAGAPCILPLLPILFGVSIGQQDWLRPLCLTGGFIMAFSGAALVFGVLPNLLGVSHDTLRKVSAFLLGGFGLLLIWPQPYERVVARFSGLFALADRVAQRAGSGNFGNFVLGLMLGVLWTPCAGPVLGSILTLIVTSENVARAGLLLVAYAVGASLPMLLIAYGGQYVTTQVPRIARHASALQKLFGVAVFLVAVALYTNYDAVITLWLSNFYPNRQMGL